MIWGAKVERDRDRVGEQQSVCAFGSEWPPSTRRRHRTACMMGARARAVGDLGCMGWSAHPLDHQSSLTGLRVCRLARLDVHGWMGGWWNVECCKPRHSLGLFTHSDSPGTRCGRSRSRHCVQQTPHTQHSAVGSPSHEIAREAPPNTLHAARAQPHDGGAGGVAGVVVSATTIAACGRCPKPVSHPPYLCPWSGMGGRMYAWTDVEKHLCPWRYGHEAHGQRQWRSHPRVPR